jgi:hypothetical protein
MVLSYVCRCNLTDVIQAIRAEAYTDDFNIPLMIGYDRNPNFTGRTKDLIYIHSFFEDIRQRKRQAVPLIIHGTGGIGKTQLVREYIYAHAAEFSSVVWIDARNLQNVRNSFVGFMQRLLDFYAGKSTSNPPPYVRIARHLGISGLVDDVGHILAHSDVIDRVVSACTRWFEREGNSNWLLVFDNVDDLKTFRISDFFPNSTSGNIILTSRRPECSRLGEGWAVDMMEEQESISLLFKSYGKSIKDNNDGTISGCDITLHNGQYILILSIDSEEARRIVEKLGYLPLAIDQAGSYLFRLSKPLHAFLPLFENNFQTILSKRPPSAVWQYGEETAVTTWEISFKAVQDEDPQAAKLLLLCSFLANDDISTDLLYRGLPGVFSEGKARSCQN